MSLSREGGVVTITSTPLSILVRAVDSPVAYTGQHLKLYNTSIMYTMYIIHVYTNLNLLAAFSHDRIVVAWLLICQDL